MNIRYLIWFYIPIVIYNVPLLASINRLLPLIALLPLMLAIVSSYIGVKSVFSKSYIFINLYIISSILFAIRESYLQGAVVFLILIFIIHALPKSHVLNTYKLENYAKYFFIGITLLLTLFILIPLVVNYPISIGSWYLVASDEIPSIRSTLDGPFLILITICFVLKLIAKYKNRFDIKIICYVALFVLVVSLVVFNRRVGILILLIIFVFHYKDYFINPRLYKISLISTILIPIFFGSILIFANDLLQLPIIKDIMVRTHDLDPEENQRLQGWLMALELFKDFSIQDVFGYREEILRSQDDRYNHFHNGYVQLYYEQGVFGTVMLFLIMFQVISRIKYYNIDAFNKIYFLKIFPIIFFILFVLNITESIYRRLSITNILFILTVLIIIKTTEPYKNYVPKD